MNNETRDILYFNLFCRDMVLAVAVSIQQQSMVGRASNGNGCLSDAYMLCAWGSENIKRLHIID